MQDPKTQRLFTADSTSLVLTPDARGRPARTIGQRMNILIEVEAGSPDKIVNKLTLPIPVPCYTDLPFLNCTAVP